MGDIKLDFSNCSVNIKKMFDIHDNQNVIINNNTSSKKTDSKKCKDNNATKGINKPEKQHHLDYPVFSKGIGVTDDHIKAVYRLLTSIGWISTQTKYVDFLELFSGKSNDCEIIFTGQNKFGNNKTNQLGISAIYVLFKKMLEEGLITTSNKKIKVGIILESHFIDTEGHFLKNISNVSTTSAKANEVIKKTIEIMKMRPSAEDIKELLENEMLSKLDINDRQDLNLRKPR